MKSKRTKGSSEAFERRVFERFPRIPPGEAKRCARYACARYADRVGALSAADAYPEHAVEVAVIAHIRHRFTDYGSLLDHGVDRDDARDRVRPKVLALLRAWSASDEPVNASKPERA